MKLLLSFVKLVFLCFSTGYSIPTLSQEPRVQIPPAHQLPDNIATSFHRRAVDSSESPWRSIGRVNIGGRAHCSGSLVADDIVLTAAHCLFAKHTGEMVVPSIVHFLAGYARGEYEAHSKVISYSVSPQFDGKRGAAAANLPNDWALLKLEKSIGKEQGFINLHESLKLNLNDTHSTNAPEIVRLSTSKITTAGYPGDRSHVLSLEEECKITGSLAKGHVMVTNCISIKGDSGGPVLQFIDEKWVLIGIQVASTKFGNRNASIGVSALAFRKEFYKTLETTTQ